MAIVITRPVGAGGASPQVSTIITSNIPPSSSEIIDSISLDNVIGVKWFIVIRNNTTNESMVQEVYGVLKTLTTSSHTIYGITGSLQPHKVDVDINVALSTMELKITNNSIMDTYLIKIVRIVI